MSLFDKLRKKKENSTNGDFSMYDNFDKVDSAVKDGILAPMYLISPMFGGAEGESNILYVPSAIIAAKDKLDNMLADALESEKSVQGFSVSPRYKGDSLVPSSIHIKAGGDVNIEQTINIW